MAEFGSGNTTSLGQLDTPESLLAKFRNMKMRRSRLEQQWKINLAFYKGDQYVYFNRSLNRIMLAPTEDGDKPRYRQRLTSNQITPGVQSYLARLQKTKPQVYATPGADDVNAQQAAKMAEYLLEAKWQDLSLDQKMTEAMLWAAVCSQGYWHISWDKDAGEPMDFLMDPTGQPIVDEELADVYRDQLTQHGIDPAIQTQSIKTGDIRVDVLSPFSVYPDDTAAVFEDSKMCVVEHFLPPADVKALYGIDVDADSVPGAPDYGIPFQAKTSGTKTTKSIYCGYWLPSPAIPEGRYCVFMDKPDTILQDGPWPFPFHRLPIVKFNGQSVPGSVYDRAVTEDALPLQKQLNRNLSQLMEYKNLTVAPQMIAPIGSFKTKRTNEPGLLMEYAGQQAPQYLIPPNLPTYVMETITLLSDGIKDCYGLTEVMEGNVPPNVEAGTAIDLLQEMASDRFAPTILANERSIGNAGKIILDFAQEYYTEPRLIRMKGANGSMAAKKFSQADIKGDIDIRVSVGSGLPRTRAGRQAMMFQLLQAGVIQAYQLPKFLDIPDLNGLQDKLNADEDQALREHEAILRGEPVSIINQQQAIQQIQQQAAQGLQIMDPQTERPFQSEDEMMQFVKSAGLQPNYYDSDDVHLDIHGSQLKSGEIENWPIESRLALNEHFSNHLQRKISLAQSEAKVNLRLNTDATADVAAKVLQSSGVREVTSQDFQEPALITTRTEDVSKPSVAPDIVLDEMSAEEQLQQMQEQHAMSMAQQGQQMEHAEQMHQAKLQQMKQKQTGS